MPLGVASRPCTLVAFFGAACGVGASVLALFGGCYSPLEDTNVNWRDGRAEGGPSAFRERRVMAAQGEQTLSGGNEQTSLKKDAQGTMTLACGHECTLYAGMMSTSGCWSKRHTKCCECMHTATESPCIYIDGLGERPCPRWQFYCAACIRRCAPDDGTMWDAGKMTRVPVFEPGTRTLMSAAPKRAVAQAAVVSRANVAMAAPSAWLDVARQTLHDMKLAEQAEQAEPQVVAPRQVAAVASRAKARKPQAAAVPSQPTARKPRRPALVCDEETPCTCLAPPMHTPCTCHAPHAPLHGMHTLCI